LLGFVGFVNNLLTMVNSKFMRVDKKFTVVSVQKDERGRPAVKQGDVESRGAVLAGVSGGDRSGCLAGGETATARAGLLDSRTYSPLIG
jgi:hypothetical protein